MGGDDGSTCSESNSSRSSSSSRRRAKKKEKTHKKEKRKSKKERKKKHKGKKDIKGTKRGRERISEESGRGKEMLREAKRYLKEQQRDAMSTFETSSIDDVHSAAAIAAQKVAAARAAALKEDAFLSHIGAPRSFASASVDTLGDESTRTTKLASRERKKRQMIEEKERLEDIAPKATGRDAIFEKRASAREANREAAAAKEDAVLGGMIGDELGGGDDFTAALAARRRMQEIRQRRRGIPDANQVAERVKIYRAQEAEKMAEFHDLVSRRGGEKIQMPPRDSY